MSALKLCVFAAVALAVSAIVSPLYSEDHVNGVSILVERESRFAGDVYYEYEEFSYPIWRVWVNITIFADTPHVEKFLIISDCFHVIGCNVKKPVLDSAFWRNMPRCPRDWIGIGSEGVVGGYFSIQKFIFNIDLESAGRRIPGVYPHRSYPPEILLCDSVEMRKPSKSCMVNVSTIIFDHGEPGDIRAVSSSGSPISRGLSGNSRIIKAVSYETQLPEKETDLHGRKYRQCEGKRGEFPCRLRQILFGGGVLISVALLLSCVGCMLWAGNNFYRQRYSIGGVLLFCGGFLMFLSWSAWGPWL